MERDIQRTMERLGIDREMWRFLEEIWKQGCRTNNSCIDDGEGTYLMLVKGNKWFEENAPEYGLEKIENSECCPREFEDDVRRFGLDPKKFTDQRKSCGVCGAGVNGYVVYRGKLEEESSQQD